MYNFGGCLCDNWEPSFLRRTFSRRVTARVIQKKIKYQPIRTREIGAVSLSDVLYILYVVSFLFNIYNATERKYRSSSATLFKKILWHRCFLVNFVKFPKNTFSYRTPLVAASENKISKCISNKSWFSSVFSPRHSAPRIRILKTSVRLHLWSHEVVIKCLHVIYFLSILRRSHD